MNHFRLVTFIILFLSLVLPAQAAPTPQIGEVQGFLDAQPGPLKTYLDDDRPAAFHLESASAYYGFSPRLHLGLLEAVNHLLSDPSPPASALRQPYGPAGPDGFALQIEWASRELRAGLGPYTRPPTLRFTDGTTLTLSLEQAPEGVAVQRFLSIGRSQPEWRTVLERFNDAFQRYFNNELPVSARPAPAATSGFLRLPWRAGTPMVHLAYFDHVYPTVDTGSDGNSSIVNYLGQGGVQYNSHDGHDFYFPNQPVGTPILAAAPGIAYARTERGNGVVILHDNGYETVYWHLDTFAPLFRGLIDSSQGVPVSAGAYLGTSGRSGFVQGNPHLHFEVRHNGRQVDPYGWYGPGDDPCTAYVACERSSWLWHTSLAGSYDFTPPDAVATTDRSPPEALFSINPRPDLKLLARFDGTSLPEVGNGLPFEEREPAFALGRWGRALRVAGAAALNYPTEGNLSAQSGTMAFWAQFPTTYPASSTGRHYLVAASANINDPARTYPGTLALRREPAANGGFQWNLWTVGADAASTHNLTAADTLRTGWHHIAFSWDATTGSKSLYFDGKRVAEARGVALPSDVGPLLSLGRFASGGAPSGVTFDELAIFDRALPSNEIATLADSSEPLVATLPRVASNETPPRVSIDLNARDRDGGVQRIEVAVDGAWSDPVPYEETLRWPLPAANGAHTVAVRFFDTAGNSTTLTGTVVLERAASPTTPPSASPPRSP